LKKRPSEIHISGKRLINNANSFMDIEIKTWVYDILNAINEIESFFADTSLNDFAIYQNDIKTKRAVESNL
jgi:hypothetical protein